MNREIVCEKLGFFDWSQVEKTFVKFYDGTDFEVFESEAMGRYYEMNPDADDDLEVHEIVKFLIEEIE